MKKRNRFLVMFAMVLSCTLCSIAVNWVALPNGFVVTGLTGLSMTAASFVNVNYALIFYGLTLVMLLCTFFFLGYQEVSNIIVLSVLYPLVLWGLNHVQVEIILQEKLIAVMLFGVIYGVGAGITYRLGYSYGGTDTLSKILKKKIFRTAELKNIMLVVEGTIMVVMLSAFSLDVVAYAFVGQIVYINSMNYMVFNLGPKLYEVEINFVAENIQRKLKTMTDQDEKAELIFKFLGMLNKDEEQFYLTIYKGFDQTIKVGEETVRLLDQKSKNAFFKDIEDNGFYIVKRPDAKIRYSLMCQLYDAFPWIKPYDAYIDRFGIKKRKIIHPVICASKYMLVLKQTSNKNFSARSTGRIDKKGLPAKSPDKKQNLSAFSNTAIRIGETHNLFSAFTGSTIAEFNIFTRSSVIGRKSLKCILEASGDPFDIEKLKVEDNFINQNAVILNVYLKGIGLRLDFETENDGDLIYEDVPMEYVVDGYSIVDLPSRKASYKRLLDRFKEYMESYDVVEVYPGQKEDLAWDWVFSQKDIQNCNFEDHIKDMMKMMTKEKRKEKSIETIDTPIEDEEDSEDEESE